MSLSGLLSAARDHAADAARSDPAGVYCSPLGQGKHSSPNAALNVMLPASLSGLLGEMVR